MTTSNNDIILHHFDISPFAEKARLAFGLKQLSWKSVEIPLIMPKPMLTALTGGYRKTPVMQIGADVYCDTQAIAAELERRFPAAGANLFPGNTKALCVALSAWSDTAFFQPGAGLSMGTNEGLPEDLLADRRAFFSFMDFGQLDQQLPDLYGQFRAHLQLIDTMLADGRTFLLGEQAGWADVLGYFPVWMSRSNIADSNNLTEGLENLLRWETQVASIGHGSRSELSAEDALKIAAAAEPIKNIDADGVRSDACFEPEGRLSSGCTVSVSANDYGQEKVTGTLAQLDHESICIHRQDDTLGNIAVHFPRIGYNVHGVT